MRSFFFLLLGILIGIMGMLVHQHWDNTRIQENFHNTGSSIQDTSVRHSETKTPNIPLAVGDVYIIPDHIPEIRANSGSVHSGAFIHPPLPTQSDTAYTPVDAE